MIFESERLRKQIKWQFNYWLREAKDPEEARRYAEAIGRTGGCGIVLKRRMEKEITKLNEE